MLAISSYLNNLLSTTGDTYHKMLRFKAHRDTLKKHFSGILDFSKWNSIILPCFEQLASIAYINKWDAIVFRWSIAMSVD